MLKAFEKSEAEKKRAVEKAKEEARKEALKEFEQTQVEKEAAIDSARKQAAELAEAEDDVAIAQQEAASAKAAAAEMAEETDRNAAAHASATRVQKSYRGARGRRKAADLQAARKSQEEVEQLQKPQEIGDEEPEWEEYLDEDGTPYYHSRTTGETVWERPEGSIKAGEPEGGSGEDAVETVELSDGWVKLVSPTEGAYYHHAASGVTQWDTPTLESAQDLGSSDDEDPKTPPEWETIVAEDGTPYYHHRKSGVVQWERPQGVATIAEAP